MTRRGFNYRDALRVIRPEKLDGDGGDSRVLAGNCLDVQPTSGKQLRWSFADPRCNIGVDYDNGRVADRLPRDECRTWPTRRREYTDADLLAGARRGGEDG